MTLLFPPSLWGNYLKSEEEGRDSIVYRVETRASFGTGEYTPFWLVSNIHGLGAPEFNNGFVRGEIYKEMNSSKKFDWGAGADLTGAWNLPASFAIRQLYAELRYRKLFIAFGSRNYDNPFNDRKLSSGDLLFSGNAMAIPQLRIGTYDYAPFWGTKGWFSVKGYLTYGMFTDSKWQKNWVRELGDRASNILFCSRGLWLKGGDLDKFPLTFEVGVEMGTQFGGKVYKDGKIIDMPDKLIDWIKAIVPIAGDSSTPEGEQTNVQGNMTGEYSMNTIFIPADGWKIRAYWEHYFEDHSQMTFEYGLWKDGLWGLELSFPKNRFLDKFVFEYIATKDQTGPVNHDYTPEIPEQVSGGDNYFNHYLYNCWQNWGMSIGTPLALSPLYNSNHVLYIYNTRFIAYHIGLQGKPLTDLYWRALFTISSNWGTYRYPYPDVYHDFSGLLEISYNPRKLKGFYTKAAFAWDKGKLLGDNYGGMVAIGYEGSFSFKNKASHNSEPSLNSKYVYYRK